MALLILEGLLKSLRRAGSLKISETLWLNLIKNSPKINFMADRERYENIKEKIRNKEMDFEEVCFILVSAEKTTQSNLIVLLLVAEEIAFPSFVQVDKLQNMPRHNLYKKYEQILNENYPKFLHLFCKLLKECSSCELSRECAGAVFLERSIEISQGILSALQSRSKNEVQLGYISAETLSMLLDLMKSNSKNFPESLEGIIKELKKMEDEIEEFLKVQMALEPFFKLLRNIIEFIKFRGEHTMISLVKSLQKIELIRESLYSTYYKNIPFFSWVLLSEIRVWAFTLIKPVHFYVDPGYPLLAGALVIRPEEICNNGQEKEISLQINMILRELIRYTPLAPMRINHLYIEVGEMKTAVSVDVWNVLYHIFNMNIIRCEINFSTRNIVGCNRFIGDFFNSLIAPDIISLSIYPEMPLSSSVVASMIDNLRVKSLTLKESSRANIIEMGVTDFLYLISRKPDNLFKHIKELFITSPFHHRTVVGLQRIFFFQVNKLLLEFISGHTPQQGSLKQISEIVNPSIFPNLNEITVKNMPLSKEDFDYLNVSMNLVQTKYRRFYCPSGSSYTPEIEGEYRFNLAEAVSFNAGVIFIVPEHNLYNWSNNYSGSVGSNCIICKEEFKNSTKERALILPCGSVSHMRCAHKIFLRKKNPCCPFCKKKVYLVMGLPMAVDTMFRPVKSSFPYFM